MQKVKQGIEYLLESPLFSKYFGIRNGDFNPAELKNQFTKNLLILFTEITHEFKDLNTEISDLDYSTKDNLLIEKLNNLSFTTEELSSFYEEILSLNLHESTRDNLNRKSSGVYYTTHQLAFPLSRMTIDAYIKTQLNISNFSFIDKPSSERVKSVVNLLATCKLADPSCGIGRFLICYIEYIELYLIEHIQNKDNLVIGEKISKNIYGFDIDVIALYLAKINISWKLKKLFPTLELNHINSNFQQVNPLLSYDEHDFHRLSYMSGFIYSKGFGRPSNFDFGNWNLILGNPPWEKVRFEEKAQLRALITKQSINASSKSDRELISVSITKTHPKISYYLVELAKHINNAKSDIKKDPLFVNSARSELNTGALFLELVTRMINKESGVIGFLVKSSTLTHHANRRLFKYLKEKPGIISVYDFINKERYFPIDSRERFSWIILGKHTSLTEIGMNIQKVSEIRDPAKVISLSKMQIDLLSSDSSVLPSFSKVAYLELLLSLYSNNPKFADVYRDTKFGRLVHLTTHSRDILKKESKDTLPVLEGKFIDRYDGQYSDYSKLQENDRYLSKSQGSKIDVQDKLKNDYQFIYRYFITKKFWEKLTTNHKHEYSIFWRSTTSASNQRTCIATILPHGPAIQSLQMLQLPNASASDYCILLATMNSKIFDFLVRNRLTGIDLTQNIIKQIPVPHSKNLDTIITFDGHVSSIKNHIICRVKFMLSGDVRLSNFSKQTVDTLPLVGKDRHLVDNELDLLLASAYGITETELTTIMSAFKKS